MNIGNQIANLSETQREYARQMIQQLTIIAESPVTKERTMAKKEIKAIKVKQDAIAVQIAQLEQQRKQYDK